MHVTCIAAVLADQYDRWKHTSPSALSKCLQPVFLHSRHCLKIGAQAVAHHIGETKYCTREVISGFLHPCIPLFPLYAMHLLRVVLKAAEWMADEGKLTSDNHPYDMTERGCHELQELQRVGVEGEVSATAR